MITTRHGLHSPRLQRAKSQSDAETGMATAEFAVALPAVVIVLAFVVTLTQALAVRHQTLHAASVAARVAARAEPDAAVRQAAVAVGPRNAQVTINSAGDWVRVTVSTAAPTVMSLMVPRISETVVAYREPAGDGVDVGAVGR